MGSYVLDTRALSALYRAGTMTHRAMDLLRWRIAESAEKLKRALSKEAP